MSDTIVVGTDGSDTAKQAVAEAVRLAKALNAEIHLVSAFVPLRAHVSGAPEGAAKVWQPLPDSQVEATLDQAQAAVRLSGVKVTTHAAQGDPAHALLQTAEEVDADLIVVGSRGMHGAKRVLGSVPNTVSHRATCNVLIVHTD